MPIIPIKGAPINLSAQTTLVTKDGKATVPFWNWLTRLTGGVINISGAAVASAVTPVVDSQIALYDDVTGNLIKPASGTGVVHATTGVYSVANVDLTSEVTGDLPFSNLTPASAASKLLGRGSAAGAGDYQEISLGSGVSMSGTTLTATGSGGTVTNTGTLTNHALIKGNGGVDVSALGSLGTTTTVLHGNAAGDPTFATVVEADQTLADNTTWNVTTSAHGYAPKAPNDATYYLDGTGMYSVPGGTGPGGFINATGSPASGNLAKWSGATSMTNADLTGAVTTSGGVATTIGDIPGRLIGIQTITATGAGTYTPTSGTTSIVIELVGGGPGGGGATTGAAGSGSAAQSASGAGYLRKRLTTAFSGAAYVVGAKGTGGAAGNNNGNAATDTTFTATGGGGTVYTASKGTPGLGAAANGQGPISSRVANVTPGTGTNGDLNIAGGIGNHALTLSTVIAVGAKGGDSQLGKAAAAANVSGLNTSAAGGNATGFGAGGGGGIVLGTGASVAGGDGSDGVLIIYEYS